MSPATLAAPAAPDQASRSSPPPTLPDTNPLTAMLRRAGQGDERALERLLRELYTPIVRALRRRMNNSHAEPVVREAAIEALVRVAQSHRTCRADSDAQLVGWALAIARNCLTDELRGNWMRHTATVLLSELDASLDAESDHDLSDRSPGERVLLETMRRVHDALAPEAQTVLWMRLVDGGTWEQIGRELGTTASGAKRRYQRATARLRGEVLRCISRLPEPERALALGRLRTLGVDGIT